MTSPYSKVENLRWLMRYFRPSLKNPTGLKPSPRHAGSFDNATTRILFFGDLMCLQGDVVPEVSSKLQGVFKRANLVIGNCEAPVMFEKSRPDARYLGHFAMASEFLVSTLRAFGADPNKVTVSLANNHAADQGVEGITKTLERLAAEGITVVGTTTRGPIELRELGRLRIGIAAYTQWLNSEHRLEPKRNVWRRDGFMALDWEDIKAQHRIDTMIALPHWDYEFAHFPRKTTVEDADELHRLGFRFVVAAHQHVVQPLRVFKSHLCWFGAGNLTGPDLERLGWPVRLGALLEVGLDDKGQRVAYRTHGFVQSKEKGRWRVQTLAELEGEYSKKFSGRYNDILPRPDAA